MGSKAAAGAPQGALIKALRLHLEASLLPGDGPADKAALDEAAQFLLAAAHSRKGGESLVHIESDTGERRLRVALVNDDMPFLVDSIAATFAAQGIAIDRLLHPVAQVTRDGAGASGKVLRRGRTSSAGAAAFTPVGAVLRRVSGIGCTSASPCGAWFFGRSSKIGCVATASFSSPSGAGGGGDGSRRAARL